MVSRQSSHSMTSCPQHIAVPFAVCLAVCFFWWFRRDCLHVTPQASSTIRHNIKIFHVMLSNLMFSQSVWCSANTCVRCTIRHYAEPFHVTLHCLYVRCTIRYNAEPFHATLYHLCVRCTIRHYAELFHVTLHCLYVRCIIQHYAELFDATLHHLCVRYATRHYPEPFDATLYSLFAVLQMSA